MGTDADILNDEQVQAIFAGGPDVRKAEIALIGDTIYKRDGGVWYALDQPRESLDGSA